MKYLDDLNIFGCIVRYGNFAEASKRLGIPAPTLTRRIQSLEDVLDVRLFNRNARKLVLTDAGHKFYQKCSPLIDEILLQTENISNENENHGGQLKVACPQNFINFGFQKFFSNFLKHNPDIDLYIETSTAPDELNAEDWDAFITPVEMNLNNVSFKKLGQITDILVASPQFLSDSFDIIKPEDLDGCDLLKGKPLVDWKIYNGPQFYENTSTPKLLINELMAVKQACLAGLGITLIPNVFVEKEIHKGTLVHLLPEWASKPRDVYIVYKDRIQQSKKLNIFIDALMDHGFKF